MKTFSFAVAVVLLAIGAGIAAADTITIDASTDVWIRESAPDSTYEDDWVSVGYHDGATRRYGLIEFDINSVEESIVGAHLELYALDRSHNDLALSQQAGLLVPAGLSTTTWNNLWTTKSEVSLQALGFMELAANLPKLAWYQSNAATANDLAALNSQRTGTGMVTMLLAASFGNREWSDGLAGFAPRLVLTTAVPEPSAVMLLTTGLIGLICYAWRKR